MAPATPAPPAGTARLSRPPAPPTPVTGPQDAPGPPPTRGADSWF